MLLFQLFRNKFLLHLFFLFFSIALILPVLMDSKVVNANDLNGNNVTQLYFRDSILNYHTFPQWNPYLVQGIPSVADPLYGIYNPLLSVPLLLFDYDTALKITYVLLVFLACETMYLLGSRYINSTFISVLLALTYASSGYVAARILAGHIEKSLVYPLLPLFVFSVSKVIEKKNLLWSGILGGVLSLFLLSGDTYTAAYSTYPLLLIIVYFFFKDRRVALFLSLSPVLFLLFSSLKILPYLELQAYLHKMKEPFLGSPTIVSIVRFLFIPFDWPYEKLDLMKHILSWGDFESAAFIGPFSALGIVGLWAMRKDLIKPKNVILPLFLLVFVLLSMPAWKLNPYHWLVQSFSFLQYFRVPSRIFAYLTVIVLLFFGMTSYVLAKKKKSLRPFVYAIVILNLLLTVIFFEAFLLQHPLTTKQTVANLDYKLYDDFFSWIEKNNKERSYTMIVNHIHLVPYEVMYAHNLLQLNTNYGLLLKQSPAAEYAFVPFPPPSTYNDIVPGFIVSHDPFTGKIPWKYSLVYEKSNVKVLRVEDTRPFAVIEKEKTKAYKALTPVFNVNSISVTADSRNDDTISLLTSNYPGWQAMVNGEKVRIEKGRFLKVKTTPGKHTYTFNYENTRFKWGFVISLLSLVTWCILVKRKWLVRYFKAHRII
jgi:hypothetical protein